MKAQQKMKFAAMGVGAVVLLAVAILVMANARPDPSASKAAGQGQGNTPGGITLRRTSQQSLVFGQNVVMWESVTEDQGDGYWSSGNPGIITIPRDGWYAMTEEYVYAPTLPSYVQASWRYAGSDAVHFGIDPRGGSGARNFSSVQRFLHQGEQIEAMSYVNGSSTKLQQAYMTIVFIQ